MIQTGLTDLDFILKMLSENQEEAKKQFIKFSKEQANDKFIDIKEEKVLDKTIKTKDQALIYIEKNLREKGHTGNVMKKK